MATVPPAAQQGTPYMNVPQQDSNVVPPSQYGQQQGFFDQQQAPQQGAANTYYNTDEQKFNPQTQVNAVPSPMGTPAPAYTQPHQPYNQQPTGQPREVAELGSGSAPMRGPNGAPIAELG
jgi:hypothetical protein